MSNDPNAPIISSIIDDDLYKASMQNAVCKLYPNAIARYTFINRGETAFPSGFGAALRKQVEHLSTLRLQKEEKEFLLVACYFLGPAYADFLGGYQYDPDEVKISQSDENLQVSIEGPWYRAILWEVKLMALISELYFNLSPRPQMIEDCICTPLESQGRARSKAQRMSTAGVSFADFGTRRRYSFANHDRIIETLKDFKNFTGTSNLLLAMRYGLTPIGTQAHEWFQFHAAKYGFRMANTMALGRWVDVYKGDLGIALTDTFTTKDFFRNFDKFFAKLFDGLRHDSDDPIVFSEKVIAHYQSLRIDPTTKTIVFSDGLDDAEAIRIKKHLNGRIRNSNGIGTFVTNDVGAKPLNMVIKLTGIKFSKDDTQWTEAIKLSDVPGKHTGDSKTIELAKQILGV